MSSFHRTALAMGAYVLGLLLLFGSAFVYLGGIGSQRVEPEAVSATTEPTADPAAQNGP